MTVSILLPTRGRPWQLLRCITYICSTATSGDFEILIRYDDDDKSMIGIRSLLNEYVSKIKFFCGERHGYTELDSYYYATLENEAKGKFVWIASDDMVVQGDWIEALKEVPDTGYIAQPEISKLGFSTYYKAQGQAFPIFPRHCWKRYSKTFPCPFDLNGDKLLRQQGWKTWFLQGVTMWHDRPTDEELHKHRTP